MNVLITGTSTGIGKETAQLFLSKGFNVYGIDKDPSAIEDDKYKHLNCDLTDFNTYPESLPKMDYVINNAGTDNPLEAIKTNLISLFQIEDRWIDNHTKCVINIASTSAYLGIENREYVASKGGVLSYTRQLAKRMAKWGGRCNSISPGAILTEMNEHILQDESKRKAVSDENLLKKWIEPKEVSEAIYFLCMSSSITGIDLVIDAGESINHTEIK